MTIATTNYVDRLRDQAMALPVEERVDLVDTLTMTYDGKPIGLDKAPRAKAILCDQIFRLAVDERDALIRDLMTSIDGLPHDPDTVAAAWGKEIRRRIAEIESGEAKLLTWEECDKSAQAAIAAVRSGGKRRKRHG